AGRFDAAGLGVAVIETAVGEPFRVAAPRRATLARAITNPSELMGIKRRGPLPEEGAPLAQSVRNQDVQPRVNRAGRTGTAGPTGRLVRVGVPGAVLP